MSLRFIDLDSPASESPDFHIRKVTPTLTEMFVVFLTLVLTGLFILFMVTDQLALSSLLFVVIGLAAVYATTQIHRHREKQRATEFQNALFSAALAKGYRFCLIVRKDGTMVYRNPGFNKSFPNCTDGMTLTQWLEKSGAPSSDIAGVVSSINAETEATARVKLTIGQPQSSSMLLAVEPIERLNGFVLIRGQDQS